MKMNIEACRLCLSTQYRLHKIGEYLENLKFLGLTSPTPPTLLAYICSMCRAELSKLCTFKIKCYNTQAILEHILTRKREITLEDIIQNQPNCTPHLDTIKLQQINIFGNQQLYAENQETHTVHQESLLNYQKSFPGTYVEQVEVKQEIDGDNLDQDTEFCLVNTNIDVNEKINNLAAIQQETSNKLRKETPNKIRKERLKTRNKKKIPFNKNNKTRNLRKELIKKETLTEKHDPNVPVSESFSSKLSEVLVQNDIKIDRPQKKIEDYYDFARKHNMKVKFYSKDEQVKEMANRKEEDSYINARLKCETCFKGFSSDTAYKNHRTAHTRVRGQYLCDLCHMYFMKKGARDKHVEEHAVKYTCVQCEDSFTNRCLAMYHFEFHSGVKFECEICKKVFRKRTTYFNHMRNSHADVSCGLCGESFVGSQGLQSHMVKSHREASKCSSCGILFVNEEVLKTHKEKSCASNIKACVKCGEGYPNKDELDKHVQENHRYEKRTCELCSKTYLDEHTFVVHWKKFHSKRAGTRTKDSSARSHSRTTARAFICDQCGKSFKSNHHLVSHSRVHTGERPYRCSLCPKTFRQPTSLKVHVKTHTDERPFKCPLCARAFRQSTHRTTHMRTHTLEKPYSCAVCEKRFSVTANLREHTRTIHEGLPPRRSRKHRDRLQ